MILWEGGTFVILTFLLSATLLYYYLKDQKKTKALQTFFAGLTHELKTPLASIRLQADVISDLVKDSQSQSLSKMTERMVEDSQNLEMQMDKILQLSRMEQGGQLNPVEINPKKFIEHLIKDNSKKLKINFINKKKTSLILADTFALQLIFKNLFENTKNHTKQHEVWIELRQESSQVIIDYFDNGVFLGDPKKLSSLFYKHESTKGSGIGLYLCKRFMERMNGKLEIKVAPKLSFKLHFQGVSS